MLIVLNLRQQVTTFATDFEAERKDRQASAMLLEEAVGELKQRDNIIQALQEQVCLPATFKCCVSGRKTHWP